MAHISMYKVTIRTVNPIKNAEAADTNPASKMNLVVRFIEYVCAISPSPCLFAFPLDRLFFLFDPFLAMVPEYKAGGPTEV